MRTRSPSRHQAERNALDDTVNGTPEQAGHGGGGSRRRSKRRTCVLAGTVEEQRNQQADEHQRDTVNSMQWIDERENKPSGLTTVKWPWWCCWTSARKMIATGRLRQNWTAQVGRVDAQGCGELGCKSNWTVVARRRCISPANGVER